MSIEGGDWCYLGEECVVRIKFLCPELVQHVLKLGANFQLREGPKGVATGTIVELVQDGS